MQIKLVKSFNARNTNCKTFPKKTTNKNFITNFYSLICFLILICWRQLISANDEFTTNSQDQIQNASDAIYNDVDFLPITKE